MQRPDGRRGKVVVLSVEQFLPAAVISTGMWFVSSTTWKTLRIRAILPTIHVSGEMVAAKTFEVKQTWARHGVHF